MSSRPLYDSEDHWRRMQLAEHSKYKTAKFIPSPDVVKSRALDMRQLSWWGISEIVVYAVMDTDKLSMAIVRSLVNEHGAEQADEILRKMLDQ